MKHDILHRYGIDLYKRIKAVVVVTAFMTNILGMEALAAAVPGTERSAVFSVYDRKIGSTEHSFDNETFILPHDLGYITDSWTTDEHQTPNNKPRTTVIHIQDTHCSYEAQKKISDIIAYFNENYDIDTVNLEGGSRNYDFSVFEKIRDKEIRRKVCDYFVQKGLVSGGEYYAINNPGEVQLWGMEDKKEYFNNLNAYRDFIKHSGGLKEDLLVLTNTLKELKKHIYSDELLEFDEKYSLYKTDEVKLEDHMGYLAEKAAEKVIPFEDLVNLNLLKGSIALEKDMNFKKAESERYLLISELKRMLSKNGIKMLIRKTFEFTGKKISEVEYYAYLAEKVQRMDLDPDKFSEFIKYKNYVSLYHFVDRSKITAEIDVLEERIKGSLYVNSADRELNLLSRNLVLMKNMLGISFTREDYEYYRQNRDSFKMRSYISFINNEGHSRGIEPISGSALAVLARCMNDMEKFYKYSFARDNAFIENLRFSMEEEHQTLKKRSKTAIMITGGFHTENLCGIFREKGISYISIMPDFKDKEEYRSPYFDILAGKEITLKDFQRELVSYFSSPSALAVKSFFSRLPVDPGDMDMMELEAAVLERVFEGREDVIKRDHYTVIISLKDIDMSFIGNKGAKRTVIDHGGKTLCIIAIPLFEVGSKDERSTSDEGKEHAAKSVADMSESDIKDLIDDLFIEEDLRHVRALINIRHIAAEGGFEEFFAKNQGYEKKLTEALYSFLLVEPLTLNVSADILGTLASRGSVEAADTIVEGIEKIQSKNGMVPASLVKTLIDAGDMSREVLLTRHEGFIKMMDRLPTLSGIDKKLTDKMFMDWFMFMENAGKKEQARFSGNDIIRYFVIREKIVDLIVRIREILAADPDMEEEEIFRSIGRDTEELPLRTRIWFKIGVKKYVRDRKKVKWVAMTAEEAGIDVKKIKDTGMMESEMIYPGRSASDTGKRDLVAKLLGFIPEKDNSGIRIVFTPDTIHLILDEDTYLRFRDRRKKNISFGEPDDHDSENIVDGSSGYFDKEYSGYFGKDMDLSGIITFEKHDPGSGEGNISSVLRHELEHKFFSGYAELALLNDISFGDIIKSMLNINVFSGERRIKEIEKLVKELMIFFLFPIQNEFVAKLAAGDGIWSEWENMSSWLSSYERGYRRSDKTKIFLSIINEGNLREKILDAAFSRIKDITFTATPKVDRIIVSKASAILSSRKVEHKEALKAAAEWTALFLQTIPATAFHRLDIYIYVLSARIFMDRIFPGEDQREDDVRKVMDMLKRADHEGDTSGAMAEWNNVSERFGINKGGGDSFSGLWDAVCQTEIDLCILDAQRSYVKNKRQASALRRRSAERLKWLARMMKKKNAYTVTDARHAAGLNTLAVIIENEDTALDLAALQDIGFSRSLEIEKKISENTEKGEWDKLGISTFRAACYIRTMAEEKGKILLRLSDGKEIRFKEGSRYAFELTFDDLVNGIRHKDIKKHLKRDHLSLEDQSVGKKEREEAAERIEAVANEMSSGDDVKNAIEHLAMNIKKGSIYVNLMGAERFSLDVYADGEGIYINSKYSRDPEKIIELIVYGTIAHVTGDHVLAKEIAQSAAGKVLSDEHGLSELDPITGQPFQAKTRDEEMGESLIQDMFDDNIFRAAIKEMIRRTEASGRGQILTVNPDDDIDDLIGPILKNDHDDADEIPSPSEGGMLILTHLSGSEALPSASELEKCRTLKEGVRMMIICGDKVSVITKVKSDIDIDRYKANTSSEKKIAFLKENMNMRVFKIRPIRSGIIFEEAEKDLWEREILNNATPAGDIDELRKKGPEYTMSKSVKIEISGNEAKEMPDIRFRKVFRQNAENILRFITGLSVNVHDIDSYESHDPDEEGRSDGSKNFYKHELKIKGQFHIFFTKKYNKRSLQHFNVVNKAATIANKIGIAPEIKFFIVNNTIVLVMRNIEGQTLKEFEWKEGEVYEITSRIGFALGKLHGRGIRHGNLTEGTILKTRNIYLTAEKDTPHVKFTDFSQANISQTSEILEEERDLVWWGIIGELQDKIGMSSFEAKRIDDMRSIFVNAYKKGKAASPAYLFEETVSVSEKEITDIMDESASPQEEHLEGQTKTVTFRTADGRSYEKELFGEGLRIWSLLSEAEKELKKEYPGEVNKIENAMKNVGFIGGYVRLLWNGHGNIADLDMLFTGVDKYDDILTDIVKKETGLNIDVFGYNREIPRFYDFTMNGVAIFFNGDIIDTNGSGLSALEKRELVLDEYKIADMDRVFRAVWLLLEDENLTIEKETEAVLRNVYVKLWDEMNKLKEDGIPGKQAHQYMISEFNRYRIYITAFEKTSKERYEAILKRFDLHKLVDYMEKAKDSDIPVSADPPGPVVIISESERPEEQDFLNIFLSDSNMLRSACGMLDKTYISLKEYSTIVNPGDTPESVSEKTSEGTYGHADDDLLPRANEEGIEIHTHPPFSVALLSGEDLERCKDIAEGAHMMIMCNGMAALIGKVDKEIDTEKYKTLGSLDKNIRFLKENKIPIRIFRIVRTERYISLEEIASEDWINVLTGVSERFDISDFEDKVRESSIVRSRERTTDENEQLLRNISKWVSENVTILNDLNREMKRIMDEEDIETLYDKQYILAEMEAISRNLHLWSLEKNSIEKETEKRTGKTFRYDYYNSPEYIILRTAYDLKTQIVKILREESPIDAVLADRRFVDAVIEIQKRTDGSWKEHHLVIEDDLRLDDLGERIEEGHYTSTASFPSGGKEKIYVHSHPGSSPLPSGGDMHKFKTLKNDAHFMIIGGDMAVLITDMKPEADIEEYSRIQDIGDVISFLEDNSRIRMFRIKGTSLNERPRELWAEDIRKIRRYSPEDIIEGIRKHTKKKAREAGISELDTWVSEVEKWVEEKAQILDIMVIALKTGLSEDAAGFVKRYDRDFMNMLRIRKEIEFSYKEMYAVKGILEERTQRGFMTGQLDHFVTGTLNEFLRLEGMYYKAKDRLDRRDVSISAFNSAERRGDIVKTVVGIPHGIKEKDSEEFIHRANRELCRAGFGLREDNNQIIGFILTDNETETKKNRENAVEKAKETLRKDVEKSSGRVKGHIVVFAPEIEECEDDIFGKTRDMHEQQGNVTILKDAYTDAPLSGNGFPDIMVRYALARYVAFYYNGNDHAAAVKSINRLLSQITDDEKIEDISDLLKRVLRIRALAFESIKEWKTELEAVAKSL
ncbi:MAG: hypothetical protein ABH862_03675 [Candidatus Omnitrophota bacterium]